MNKLQALIDLRDKVEVDAHISRREIVMALYGSGDAKLADVASANMAGMHFSEANRGSLDAAKALHEAVLLEWAACVDMQNGEVAMFSRVEEDEWEWRLDVKGTPDPARAWLIAILQALIAQEQST